MGKFIDLKGQRFGRLVVQSMADSRVRRRTFWECLCDCGNFTTVLGSSLSNGNTKSCGCIRREKVVQQGLKNTIHGHAKALIGRHTPEYIAYHHAKQRCNNPNVHNYDNYGGRGIEFRFNNFFEWDAELGDKPEPKELYSVDRIDNNGHYEIGNVRWATYEQQNMNRRLTPA